MEDKVRAAITYRMEKVDEYGSETAEDVLTVDLPRERYKDLKASLEDDIRASGNAYGHASLLVYSIAKLRGYRDGYLVDVREAGEDGLLRFARNDREAEAGEG